MAIFFVYTARRNAFPSILTMLEVRVPCYSPGSEGMQKSDEGKYRPSGIDFCKVSTFLSSFPARVSDHALT